ncbi:MAG TPA: response regulator, partial [Candidatus Acidoferrum sp.]|nr:response regulator [Candidatus Acidoferrum sp.]
MRSVVLIAALFAGLMFDASASKIALHTRTERPPEMAPITVLEIIHESARYWVRLPRQWEHQADAEAGTVTLSSADTHTAVLLRFYSGDAGDAHTSAEALRQTAAPHLKGLKLMEEFSFRTHESEGTGMLFSYEPDMRCRIGLVPLVRGYVTLAFCSPASAAANGERVLTGMLSTFRSIGDEEAAERHAEERRLIRLQPIQRPAPNVIQGMKPVEPPPLPPVYEPPPPPTWMEQHREGFYLFVGFALLAALTHSVLSRHRREAEIRALSGGYLSDGTEVAKFLMPDWFAPLPAPKPILVPTDAVPVMAETSSRETAPLPDPVTEFLFEYAPEALASIRATLKELVGTDEPQARKDVLLKLHTLILGLSTEANCWELRPVWQLSSALDLLVKRIADKPKDATPSAIRTISTACDLLHELCVPGIRPNLIIEPPPRILAVDDEPLCLRALAFALQKANLAPDVAQDGKRAVELATQKPYDVIFMDIQMPEMDGLAACTNIQQTPLNSDTPIVFVTVLSDFAMRARTIAIGGTDFMAKPFLVFEMSLKAITLLMRKRLDVAKKNRAPLSAPTPVATTAKVPALVASPAAAATPAPVAVPALVPPTLPTPA